MMKKLLLLILTAVFVPLLALSQEKDTIPVRQLKNSIRINPTPMILFSNLRNLTLSYERLVKVNQSFVIQAGYLVVNPLFPDSIEGLYSFHREANFGLNVAFDYRFYPLKRNKFMPPDGLYLGPYLSYYGFKFKDEVTVNYSDPLRSGFLSKGFTYINLGLEVGYQFIFWKHLAIDMLVFGPSLTFWATTTQMDDMFTDEEKNEIIAELKDKFEEHYPTLTPFVNIDGKRQSASFKMFFRYSLSIGYHF